MCQDLAERQLATAEVDLDEAAFMQYVVGDSHEFWRRASVAAGALVRAWFDVGTEVVVAHGPFIESGGYNSLLNAQPDEVIVRHVVLRVTVEAALERVRDDPERGVSRDPRFLEATQSASVRSRPRCRRPTSSSTPQHEALRTSRRTSWQRPGRRNGLNPDTPLRVAAQDL